MTKTLAFNKPTQGKTYKVDSRCLNCHRPRIFEIPCGTLVAVFEKGENTACSNCGCTNKQVTDLYKEKPSG